MHTRVKNAHRTLIAPQLFTNRVGMCSWRWKLIIVLFHRWTRAVALKSADTQYPQRSSSGTATRAGGVYFFSLSLSLSPADQSRRIVNGFSSRTQPGTIEPGTHVPGAMESVTNPINEGKGEARHRRRPRSHRLRGPALRLALLSCSEDVIQWLHSRAFCQGPC